MLRRAFAAHIGRLSVALILLSSLVLGVLPFPSKPGQAAWLELDLAHQSVQTAVARTNPDRLGAGMSDGGIFPSTNLGQAWGSINGGLSNMVASDALPTLTITPTSGPPGTVVRFSGTGFTPGGTITIRFHSLFRDGFDTAEVRADPGGAISGSFAAPNAGSGTLRFGAQPMWAIDNAAGRRTPEVTFDLTGPEGGTGTAFFAEGATTPPFDTWFLVQNPGPRPAHLEFASQREGVVTSNHFTVGPTSRFSLFANEILPDQAFSMVVISDQPIFVERAMYVSYDGDIVPQILSIAPVWLFAEGSTAPPFQTWLLLQNLSGPPTTATITYLLEGGGTQSQLVDLPTNSRTSIFVNDVLPDAAFSIRVECDQKIVVERAMYRFPGNAATAAAGVQSPGRTWYFAEGDTTISPFGTDLPTDSWLLLQNPNNTTVAATITLFDTAGNTQHFSQTLAPLSRLNVYLNQATSFNSFGIRVDASAPVIAERSMFFGEEPRGATATFGASDLATDWHFAEGSTALPFAELISVLNPSGQEMGVTMDFFLEGGNTISRQFTVGPTSKLTVDVDTVVPDAANSARVRTSIPSVVERAMYFLKGGNTGGHDTIGMR